MLVAGRGGRNGHGDLASKVDDRGHHSPRTYGNEGEHGRTTAEEAKEKEKEEEEATALITIDTAENDMVATVARFTA